MSEADSHSAAVAEADQQEEQQEEYVDREEEEEEEAEEAEEAEEFDGDEEDAEAEDGDGESQQRHKKKRRKRSEFVDDVAEDEDDPDAEDEEDDEDDEDDAGEMADFIADGADAGADADDGDRRKKQKIQFGTAQLDVDGDDDLHRQMDMARDEQEMEKDREMLRAKYGDGFEDDDDEDYGAEEEEDRAAREKARLPSITDPKLWLVKCDPGKEEEMVFALATRGRFLEESVEDRLFIHSVFTHPASKGYIYIEADKEVHVKRAIRGLRALKWWRLQLVPMNEMVKAVKFNDKIATVRNRQWVRPKRGVYQGDLGKVVELKDQGTIVVVKLIPRIDIAAMEEARRNPEKGKRKRVGSAMRPPQKLFDSHEISELGGVVTRSSQLRYEKADFFNGNRYERGFLLKEFKVELLETENIVPTQDEIDRFQQRLPGDDGDSESEADEAAAATELAAMEAKKRRVVFMMQDHVIVSQGDLKNITGRIVSLKGQTALIKPDPHQPIDQTVEIALDDIKKFFKIGDHVKVISGMYRDETGIILQVGTREDPTEDSLSIYSDVSHREIRVATGEVIESSEISTGRESLGNYQLYDLVQISGDLAAVIIKVEIASFKVLTNRGIVETIRLQEIGAKRHSKYAMAKDNQGHQLLKDDVVNVLIGPHMGKQGTIKHIFRTTLWLYNRQYPENSGIFVAQPKHVLLVGQYTTNVKAPGSPQSSMALSAKSPHPLANPGNQPSAAFTRTRINERDPLLGKTVIITNPLYKKWQGIVREANENMLRVELSARAQTVSVKRHEVQELGAAPHRVAQNEDAYLGAQTPLIGSRTPYHDGSATPFHDGFGGATPAHDFGSRTPSHNVWAPQTPHHSSFDDEADEIERRFQPRTPQPITPGGQPLTPHLLTPDQGGSNPLTPHNPLTPNTPRTPNTPLTPGSRVPQTPAASDAAAESSESSLQYQVGCRIRCAPRKAGGPEALATVVGVLKNGTLKVHYDGDTVSNKKNLSPSEVRGAVQPEKTDQVIVLSGPQSGQVGQLMGVNHSEAIVNIQGDILILNIQTLCKYEKK